MGFVGVDTANSSIMKVFPLWSDRLALPTRELRGHDLPLDAPDDAYRELVREIRDDEHHLGALVTTHKVRVFEAAHDLFDELDAFSVQCGEISSISKRDGRLLGGAKDPLTAGLALAEMLPPDWFTAGGELVCLGSGGAGTAISTHLARTDDPPSRITVTDVVPARLDHLRKVHARVGLDPSMLRYEVTDRPDELVAAAPQRSLVVNATGLGKDRPGSPIREGTVFPEAAVVWEINYRGSLDFLHQAEAQQSARGLQVHDGWRYFVHGWTHAVEEVFDLPMTPDLVDELAALAEGAR